MKRLRVGNKYTCDNDTVEYIEVLDINKKDKVFPIVCKIIFKDGSTCTDTFTESGTLSDLGFTDMDILEEL